MRRTIAISTPVKYISRYKSFSSLTKMPNDERTGNKYNERQP